MIVTFEYGIALTDIANEHDQQRPKMKKEKQDERSGKIIFQRYFERIERTIHISLLCCQPLGKKMRK